MKNIYHQLKYLFVYMYTCMYMYVYMHMYIFIYVCDSKHVRMYTYVWIIM